MKNKNKIFLYYINFCLLAVLVSACTNEKNTAFHRGWHNMNARYNGYYYSKENIKESVKKVEKANRDDFSRLIPLFVYTNNETAKGFYSDFDKTIKKSSVVIQRHAIINKKTKEEIPNACRWIDENYMLIGKAHFYKRDLFSALEAFEYVSKKYKNPEAKYSGLLWMIRTNNEIGSYSESELIIDDIRTAKDFPQDRVFQQEFAAVSADYYIQREDYSPAIKWLTKAITLTRKKATKARYTYVLAQLYEKLGDNKKASQYYSMVPGLHPTYDMAFSAQINRAKLFDTQSGDSKMIKKQLMKMLKDDKNIEFRDQIYYALAVLAFKEKDIPLTMSYLAKSVKVSTTNSTQKALSYLMRADIYFDRPDYEAAQANYDSTISFLPKDYPNYIQINEKKKNLTSLVTNLKIIALEDSLQRLSKMSEKERNDAIDRLMVQIEKEEKRKEEERKNALANQTILQSQPANVTQPTTSSAWYFYNPATVTYGASEFVKKWGNRKLEDNWRRSEKDQVIANSTIDQDGNPVDSTEAKTKATTTASTSANNKKDRSFYLKRIPLTQDALDKSTNRIIEAYYNAGSIYKEQLLNNPKSVQTFEEFLKRYPDNKYKLSCYYQLYRTYLAMNNKSKADYYKNILLNDYPDTEYAKIIKNPDYAKDVLASKSEVEKFYTETYQFYSDGNYQQAYANCQRADTIYSKSTLMPQFAFIKALCVGRTQDINAFESALTQIVIKYPKDAVKDKAQELLDLIKKQKNPPAVTAADTASASAKPKFIFKEDGEYYWVTIAINGKGDINKFKTKLSDINAESFSLNNLSTSSVFLDIEHQLISVKTFDGKAKAMDYYNFIKNKKDAFSDLEAGTFQSFVISAENYATFYKDKNIQEYQQFFTQNFK